MKEPEEGRRCWTQDYADGAQFHMDTLPALSDAADQRMLSGTAWLLRRMDRQLLSPLRTGTIRNSGW